MSELTTQRQVTTPFVWVLILTGIVGGLFAGMFGVGGGLQMVPLLMWLANMDQRRATATSLIAIIPTAFVGSLGYATGGEVNFLAAGIVALGAVVGAPIGARLLRSLPIVLLRWMLITVIVLAAIKLLFYVPSRGAELSFDLVTIAGYLLLGLVMGLASGLFGVGGGFIAVPALMTFFGFSDLMAKGTSLLAMVPTALSGSISNVRAGLVRFRDGLIVGSAAAVASLGGVTLAFLIPPGLSSVLFACLLFYVAGQMAYRLIKQMRA